MGEKSKGLSEAPLPPLAEASPLATASIAGLRLPPAGKAEPKHHEGHRDRLRQRFAQAGPVAVADYELLELLLFRTIARRDVKPIAKALLKRFGGLSDVLNAPLALLQEVEGVGRSTALDFHIVSAVNQRAMRDQIRGREIMSSWTAVIDYCHSSMAYETREQFRILFLDKRNALIADEVQQTGTVDHTPVYPREIIRRAIELSSTAIILVHNHPSGDPKPSRSDIDVTQTIIATAKPLGILVYDHIVIGRNGHTSFKALGLI